MAELLGLMQFLKDLFKLNMHNLPRPIYNVNFFISLKKTPNLELYEHKFLHEKNIAWTNYYGFTCNVW